jgi:cell division protein FtsA
MAKSEIITGLDLGTTKVACIIAEEKDGGDISIVGVGTAPSEGLRRGVVVNLDKTVYSIKKAVAEAELMAGVRVEEVVAGIAGDHIRSINSRGVIAVSRPGIEISGKDVSRVLEQARAIAIPMDREIIHILPQEFIVDDQTGIKDPVGMSGVRLEAVVHIVTAAVTSAQNIFRAIERAGIQVRDLVLQPFASSLSVLDSEERELGCLLIDIGGGTTDLALFFDGTLRYSSVLGLGGVNVTNDIAIGLRTPRAQAETIKTRNGCSLATLVKEDEKIRVPGVGGRDEREVSNQVLSAIVEPRLEEIFSLAVRELNKSDYSDLIGAGIVITGGSSRMRGIQQLAEQVFDLPVKVGVPGGISGLTEIVSDPLYATGVGLVLYGLDNRNGKGLRNLNGANLFDRIFERMKSWFAESLNSWILNSPFNLLTI